MKTLSRFGVVGWFALCCSACGGSQPPPEEPDPTTIPEGSGGGDAEPVAPASSETVKQGRDAIEAGDFDRAVELLAKASQDDPQDPQAAFYHGVALEGAGHLKDAQGEYQRALSLSPDLVEAAANLSYLLLTEDKAEQALAVADAGLEKSPQAVPLLANRALALDVLGRAEAEAAYEALLAQAPDDKANRFNYAVLLAASEKKQEALAQLDKIRGADSELSMDVAQLYGRLEAYGACVKTLDGALSQGKSAELLVHRARCKHSAGDDTGALADLRAAVATEADNPIGHYYLGRHLMASGKKAEGRAELEKAIQLDPESPFAQAAERDLAKK